MSVQSLANKSLLHRLHRASQVVSEKYARKLGDSDLTIRQLVVLSAIADAGNPSQTNIVAATGVDRSTLADIVKRLLMRGYLTRRRSKLDARAYAVKLTDEGRSALLSAAPVLHRVESEMLTSIPAKKREELFALLDAIADQYVQ